MTRRAPPRRTGSAVSNETRTTRLQSLAESGSKYMIDEPDVKIETKPKAPKPDTPRNTRPTPKKDRTPAKTPKAASEPKPAPAPAEAATVRIYLRCPKDLYSNVLNLSGAAGTDQSYLDHALTTEIKTLLTKNIDTAWRGFDRNKYAPPKKGELQTLSRMMLQLDPAEQTSLRATMKDSLALIPLQTLLTEAATYLASDAIKALRKRLS